MALPTMCLWPGSMEAGIGSMRASIAGPKSCRPCEPSTPDSRREGRPDPTGSTYTSYAIRSVIFCLIVCVDGGLAAKWQPRVHTGPPKNAGKERELLEFDVH